jgi:hypothetical protein
MSDALVCFYCLSDDGVHVAAITSYAGTLVCEKCAGELAGAQQRRFDELHAIAARAGERP